MSMVKTVSFEERWSFVSKQATLIKKYTKEQELADCLIAMVKELNKDLVIELAHQIWLEDRENNMMIDIAYNNIVNALV